MIHGHRLAGGSQGEHDLRWLAASGFAHCEGQQFIRVHEHSQPEGRLFELVLSDGQLAALEDLQAGGGLKFELIVHARGDGTAGPSAMRAEVTKAMNLTEWVELVKQMGPAEYVNVAIKLPSRGSDDKHLPAIACLRQAQEHHLQGQYRAAVASCREALDLLSALQEKSAGKTGKLATASVMNAYRDERGDMSRLQRLVFLRVAARHLTHLGHHPPERSEDVLSRQDAAFTIAACAGLISASISSGMGTPSLQQLRDEPGSTPVLNQGA